jgi:hypothetical protein
VILAGINSATYPAAGRPGLWTKLAGPWRPKLLNEIATEVSLAYLEPKIGDILAGRIMGRVVVKI